MFSGLEARARRTVETSRRAKSAEADALSSRLHFLENRRKRNEIRSVRCGSANVFRGVAGDGDDRLTCEGCTHPNIARFGSLHIGGGKVNSIGAGGKCDVNARVDKQPGVCAFLMNDGDGFACELLERANGEIFFSKLNVVDAGACGFRNLRKQRAALFGVRAAKLAAIGNVIEQHSIYCRTEPQS